MDILKVNRFRIKFFSEPFDEAMAIAMARVTHGLNEVVIARYTAAIFRRPRPFCGKAACTRAFRDRDDLLETHVVLPAVTKIVEVPQTVTLRMKQVT